MIDKDITHSVLIHALTKGRFTPKRVAKSGEFEEWEVRRECDRLAAIGALVRNGRSWSLPSRRTIGFKEEGGFIMFGHQDSDVMESTDGGESMIIFPAGGPKGDLIVALYGPTHPKMRGFLNMLGVDAEYDPDGVMCSFVSRWVLRPDAPPIDNAETIRDLINDNLALSREAKMLAREVSRGKPGYSLDQLRGAFGAGFHKGKREAADG